MQAARNGYGSAHRKVEIGKLLPRDIGSRIDAGTRFAHRDGEDVLNMFFSQKIADKCIRLPRCRSVADGDCANGMLSQQGFDLLRGFGHAML